MDDKTAVELTFPQPDIALLTLDVPGRSANMLSRSMLDEIEKHLDALAKRTDLAGVIFISAKTNTFIVGADLREFAASLDLPEQDVIQFCQRGQNLFRRFSTGGPASVAAIHGACVGGGAELAIWCDHRVMTDDAATQFGFPEVKLGLIPGWGGTVRTPRIVGLSNAIELVTGGETIGAAEARLMGLATDVCPAERLLAAAISVVRTEQELKLFQAERARREQPIKISETELAFLGATASAMIQQQTKGNYPAPLAALELMLESSQVDVATALQMEAKVMAPLFGSPVNRALLNLFFLNDRIKKDTGLDGVTAEPLSIQHVGVVGAGIMGQGIGAAIVKRGMPCKMFDVDAEMLTKGTSLILEDVSYDKQTKKASSERLTKFAPLLTTATQVEQLADCDLVVEAIIENKEIKQDFFRQLEPCLKANAILGSNTSTIPITELAESLKNPQRFCGLHFFNPVRRMQLVEVIRGKQTSDQTVATVVEYAKRIGKVPIVVNDGPGFLVNRLLFPYVNESLKLLEEGASIKAIERAAKRFGMPMGPLSLFDMVGLDTAAYAGRTMYIHFHQRIVLSPILPALVKAKRLGKKTGRGFFSYENKRQTAEDDPELLNVIGKYFPDSPSEFSEDQLMMRLFLPMLVEATLILEEKIARRPGDVDLGLILGLGFPPFKGGLLFWADQVGAKTILEKLKPFEHIGPRYQPTEMMKQLAATNGTYYPKQS